MTPQTKPTPARYVIDSSTGSRYIAFRESDARRIARAWRELPGAIVTVRFVEANA